MLTPMFSGIFAIILASSLPALTALGSQSLELRIQEAVQAGELCGRPVQMSVTGNQLKIRFVGARSALLSTQDETVKREKCSIRIPVHIPEGLYLSKVTSRAQSQVSKPLGNSILISLSTGLSTFTDLSNQTQLGEDIAKFGLSNSYKTFAGSSLLGTEWKRELCKASRSEELLLGLDLGTFIQRDDGFDTVSVDFSGSSKGVDIWTELETCN